MYVGIDIGGTKTLVATLNDEGTIQDSRRFASNHKYDQFLRDLSGNFSQLKTGKLTGGGVGIPGLVDREAGMVRALGNLPWRNKPIRNDISKALNGVRLVIENDARLAGLSEAQLLKDKYDEILFLTISTGIGGALVHKGRLVTALQDTEMGKMPLWFDGELMNWEEFAGGRGVVKRFGNKASEITAAEDWQVVGENIAYGLGAVCSVLQPEAVVLGGGVGAYADKYAPYIKAFLAEHLHPVIRQPKAVLAAQRPDEAVLFGCYDLAKQKFGSHGKTA